MSMMKTLLFAGLFAVVSCTATNTMERNIENAWRTNSSIPLAHLIDETLTIERAYAVQTRLVRRELKNAAPIGFKAGLTSEAARERFNAASAIAGVLLRPTHSTPEHLSLSVFKGLYIETEVAMRIGNPIRNPLTSVAELRSHIDGIAAAIELPNLDYERPDRLNALDIIASNVAAAHFVTSPFAPPEQRDPNQLTATLDCNGERLSTGQARDAMGDQWQAAFWLVNTMVEQGWELERGQVLLTGALGKMVRAPEGECIAHFDGWGTLSVLITP
jgi:2-keto-4-pentenoate hydratase